MGLNAQSGAKLLLMVATYFVAAPVSADTVYRCVGRDGRTSFQSHSCGTQPAGGAMLYKYQGAKGAVSVQSAPCPDKTKTVWARPAEPELETEDSRRRQQAQLRKQSADARALSRQAGTDGQTIYFGNSSGPTEHDQRVARCNAAKRHRDDVLNQIGLRRTYDVLQALDREVAAACRGL